MVAGKTCFKCLRTLPRDCFYKHARMSDGLLGKCKDCTKTDSKAHRVQNLEKVRRYDLTRSKTEKRRLAAKTYEQTESGKAVKYRSSKRHAEMYPERAKARAAVARALRR